MVEISKSGNVEHYITGLMESARLWGAQPMALVSVLHW
jgi:hypothetical protein